MHAIYMDVYFNRKIDLEDQDAVVLTGTCLGCDFFQRTIVD